MIEDEREALRIRIRDTRKGAQAGPFWEAVDDLVAFERKAALAAGRAEAIRGFAELVMNVAEPKGEVTP